MDRSHDKNCRERYRYEVSTIGNHDNDEVVVKAVTLKPFSDEEIFTVSNLEEIISAEFPNIPKDDLTFDIANNGLMILFVKAKPDSSN